jgi:formate dehydrogenase subunit delta
MANQIATFFQSQGADHAAAGIADHINSFWEPRMRARLFDLADARTPGFHPALIDALPRIRRPVAAAST